MHCMCICVIVREKLYFRSTEALKIKREMDIKLCMIQMCLNETVKIDSRTSIFVKGNNSTIHFSPFDEVCQNEISRKDKQSIAYLRSHREKDEHKNATKMQGRR